MPKCTRVASLFTAIKNFLTNNVVMSSPALAIGSTPANVASGAFYYQIDGVQYTKTAVAAGTAPGNDVIPEDKYGAVALDIDAAGTITVAEAAANATGYLSPALAIEGIPAVSSTKVRMGYVTATKSDGAFTFGTTALNAANSTVAYTNATTALSTLNSALII